MNCAILQEGANTFGRLVGWIVMYVLYAWITIFYSHLVENHVQKGELVWKQLEGLKNWNCWPLIDLPTNRMNSIDACWNISRDKKSDFLSNHLNPAHTSSLYYSLAATRSMIYNDDNDDDVDDEDKEEEDGDGGCGDGDDDFLFCCCRLNT